MSKGKTPGIELTMTEVFDALEEIGIITHACAAVGYSKSAFFNAINRHPDLAERARVAQAIGMTKRKDYLEALAYSMAPTNPTMVMFLLKREDPSYRESYHVSTNTTVTDFTIDLGAVNRALDVAAASTEDIPVDG